LFLELIDRHAPTRQIRVTKPPAPWLNDEIRAAEKVRDRLFSQHRSELCQNPGVPRDGTQHWEPYKVARNKVNSMIRRAKTNYYKSSLDDNFKKPKLLWKNLDNLDIHSAKSSPGSTSIPFSAEALNSQFSKVFSAAPSSTDEPNPFLDNYPAFHGDTPFVFSEVTEGNIHSYIKDIKTNAKGIDEISLKMLKASLRDIAKPIQHIVNFCLLNSIFPSLWKKSVVRPIPKIDNPTVTDFRPISILPVLSKVIERAVHIQVTQYLTKNNLLDKHQSGFRAGHSTSTALCKVTGDLYSNMDNGDITCSVLLDFSKAFDLVNHKILLKKLKYLNFSTSALAFFTAYLEQRSQSVHIDSGKSSWTYVPLGVPQGSILGPLLFTIYINDLSRCLKVCSYHLYADDLQIYLPGKARNIGNIIELINSDLQSVSDWAKFNLLKLNPDKTLSILIGTSRMLQNLPQNVEKVTLNGIGIDYSSKVRNLGLIVDQNLNWNAHTSHVCSSTYLKLRNLHRHRKFLTFDMRKMLVQSLIFPIFDYCDVIYASTSDSNRNRIRKSFNSSVRFITGLRKYDHISPAIQDLNFLTPSIRQSLHVSCLTQKVLYSRCPTYLSDGLVTLTDGHAHNTRNSSTIRIPGHRLEQTKNSFNYVAAATWNQLPKSLREETDSLKFKSMARQHWLSKQNITALA
jgi:Reverse transcriptase (RNA-dependent DNA polymerase)